ncbi:MAG: GNAT family N-acetyltransferase [Caldilineaceae bacterium]
MIRRTAILTLAAPTMGREQAQSWADSAPPNRVQLALELHEVWVATHLGEAVGWVEIGGDHIAGIYVDPPHAGQGIGSALLAHAERQIQAAGYTTVRLDASWNAENFYLHRGYQPLGERSLAAGRPLIKKLT